MRSTIYMNHYPHHKSGSGNEAVTADLTASVATLGNPDSTYGHAVDLTLDTLGLDRMTPPTPSDLLVIGSQESIKRNLRQFRMRIGSIATKANEVGHQNGDQRESYLPYRLDNIAQYVLPKAIEENDFIKSIGEVLADFGEDCNDDGCSADYGKRVGWYSGIYNAQATLDSIPKETLDHLKSPLIRPDVRAKDLPTDTLLLRVLTTHWAISHADELKEHGPTTEMIQRYERECELNAEAIQRANATIIKRTGRPMHDLYLPIDVLRDLVATERSAMERESETATD